MSDAHMSIVLLKPFHVSLHSSRTTSPVLTITTKLMGMLLMALDYTGDGSVFGLNCMVSIRD